MQSAYNKGQQDAERDLNAGRRIYKTYGLAAPWHRDFAVILGERYDLTVKRVAGCRVSEAQQTYITGYNSIIADRLAAQFGDEFIAKTHEEARERCRARLEPPNTNPPLSVHADAEGRVTCPNCRKRFSTQDTVRWMGGRHTTCGQKLALS